MEIGLFPTRHTSSHGRLLSPTINGHLPDSSSFSWLSPLFVVFGFDFRKRLHRVVYTIACFVRLWIAKLSFSTKIRLVWHFIYLIFRNDANVCVIWFAGRIINRFSKDIGTMDDSLAFVFFDFLTVSWIVNVIIYSVLHRVHWLSLALWSLSLRWIQSYRLQLCQYWLCLHYYEHIIWRRRAMSNDWKQQVGFLYYYHGWISTIWEFSFS